MSFADDLLEQVNRLVTWPPTEPEQAGRRRAVSTAGYADFHLLVDEAVCNWVVER